MQTNDNAPQPDRDRSDRRQQPTSPWSAFFRGGRRIQNRRADEHSQPYFVDQFPSTTLALIVVLLVLSVSDAAITLILLEDGCEEINPLMMHLLNIGPLAFLLGKYVLTAIGIPLLLVFKNHYLFGTRFRVGYVIPMFVVMYFVLIGYQCCLLRSSPSVTVPTWAAAAASAGYYMGRY